jgi:FAD/FMN-containing dehydrogenase
MVGATLGGGVSKYQGVHGMIIDALESVKLVTASGELVTASRTSNRELFWGMRGAGFNFGIVTEATYRIHGARNGGTVLNADFRFPARLNATFFEILQSFDETLPASMSFFISVNNHPTFGVSIACYY